MLNSIARLSSLWTLERLFLLLVLKLWAMSRFGGYSTFEILDGTKEPRVWRREFWKRWNHISFVYLEQRRKEEGELTTSMCQLFDET